MLGPIILSIMPLSASISAVPGVTHTGSWLTLIASTWCALHVTSCGMTPASVCFLGGSRPVSEDDSDCPSPASANALCA